MTLNEVQWTSGEAIPAEADRGADPSLATNHGYLTLTARLCIGGSVLILGVVYLIIEFLRTRAIVDSLFVSLLVGATFILLIGLKSVFAFLANRGVDFYRFVLASDDPQEVYRRHAHLCAGVSSPSRMTLAGLAYGTAIASAPFVLDVWSNDALLRIALALFLFCVNFATGAAFYGLLSFFVFSTQMGSQAKIDLWQISNPSTDFLTGATRRISIFASAYVALSLTSILFSVLPGRQLVVGYSVFAAVVLVLSILIPALPLARQIRRAKNAALLELDRRIQRAFFDMMAKTTEGLDDGSSRLHAMLSLRERIERLHSWPFKIKSITSAGSVLLVSIIPILVQVILERLAK